MFGSNIELDTDHLPFDIMSYNSITLKFIQSVDVADIVQGKEPTIDDLEYEITI